MALTLPAHHQVHFEGITGVSKLADTSSNIPANSVIKAYPADQVYGVTGGSPATVGIQVKALYGDSDTNDMLNSTTVGMFYPGAVYEDAAGQKQLVANMGHFGRLDSLEGAAKMASMNVFTAADGGK